MAFDKIEIFYLRVIFFILTAVPNYFVKKLKDVNSIIMQPLIHLRSVYKISKIMCKKFVLLSSI